MLSKSGVEDSLKGKEMNNRRTGTGICSVPSRLSTELKQQHHEHHTSVAELQKNSLVLSPTSEANDLEISLGAENSDILDLEYDPGSPWFLGSGDSMPDWQADTQSTRPGITEFGDPSMPFDQILGPMERNNDANSMVLSAEIDPSLILDDDRCEGLPTLITDSINLGAEIDQNELRRSTLESSPAIADMGIIDQPCASSPTDKNTTAETGKTSGDKFINANSRLTSSIACQRRPVSLQYQQSYESQALPGPQQTHIRINQVSFFGACLTNLSMLGLSLEAASLDDCSSPFFRSGIPIDQTCKMNFKHLKADLQPRHAQIYFNHHPYLDVIPFPEFRERAITFLSMPEPYFDEDELCLDLLNDGIICWGSDSGAGSGAPWDARSWEVTPWFIRKWWMLLGGKRGIIYQQTQWWRQMRGIQCEISW